MTGDSGDNNIRGLLGNDLMDGGAGFDTADYRNAEGAVVVTLGEGSGAGRSSGAEGVDRLLSFEAIAGGFSNDRLTGNSGSNTIRGNLGNDILNGGAGYDTASYQFAAGSVVATLGEGRAAGRSSGADGVDRLLNVEGLTGGDFDDRLTGNSLDNSLRGNGGDDVLDGRAGFDFANYSRAGGAVTVTLGEGTTGGRSSGADGADRLFNVEGVTGSDFDDRLTGNSGTNTLNGRFGNDVLDGGSGTDFFDFTSTLSRTGNVDAIQNFSSAGDTIRLSKAVFSAVLGDPGSSIFGQFALSTQAAQADDRIVYNPRTGQLFYDPDGGPRTNAVLFADVDNPRTAGIASDDFVLIA